MYGDTDVMRKQVSRLREQGSEIRAMADQLVAQAEAVTWDGRAGDSMRERIRERATRLREAADRHDVAATTLDTHTQLVDELKDSIAETERRATALLEDGALPRFEPPAPGHEDWLAVSLPGIRDRGPGDTP
jgi:chromosome segregation ATPase